MTSKTFRLTVAVAFVFSSILGFQIWDAMFRTTLPEGEVVAFTIEKGESFDQIARRLVEIGIIKGQPYIWIVAKTMRAENRIKAGEYLFKGPMKMVDIFDELIRGRLVLHRQTFFEGWTIREIMESLEKNPTITKTENPLRRLGYPSVEKAEGWCFPDTYKHYRGDSDYKILALCFSAMEEKLEELWQERAPGLPFDTLEEALTLASIVEAETNMDSERAEVAGVLVSRLRKNMRLQADPTVIYGLGADFDNNLTRAHLKQRPEINPYNTYRIHGLPPGPICNPGLRSLEAALQPDLETENLYYVAVGDGSHYFSASYEEHAAAVRKYQLGID